MKKVFFLLPVLFVLLFSTGCPDNEIYSISVYNDSDQDIAVYAGLGGGGTLYPDTALPVQNWTELISKKRRERLHYNLEDIDTFYYFILSQDTIDKYPWDTIRSKYMILRRYKVNKKELKGKIITYP